MVSITTVTPRWLMPVFYWPVQCHGYQPCENSMSPISDSEPEGNPPVAQPPPPLSVPVRTTQASCLSHYWPVNNLFELHLTNLFTTETWPRQSKAVRQKHGINKHTVNNTIEKSAYSVCKRSKEVRQ